ncbi:MAG: GNAT family N-acetyltransferase [Pseudomonadota bacterium]
MTDYPDLTLQVARLTLRRFREDDLGDLHRVLGDPDVMAYSDDGPLSQAGVARWLARAIAGPANAPGYRAVVLTATQQLIGYVSLTTSATRIGPGALEFGIRLARPAWGQGLAREAALAVLDDARRRCPDAQVMAVVDPGNLRSVALLTALGFRYQSDISFPGYDHPDHLYARPDADCLD